jgi:hypothetical protein
MRGGRLLVGRGMGRGCGRWGMGFVRWRGVVVVVMGGWWRGIRGLLVEGDGVFCVVRGSPRSFCVRRGVADASVDRLPNLLAWTESFRLTLLFFLQSVIQYD